jgi:hypothetical protein
MKDGSGYVGRADYDGLDWREFVVYLMNSDNSQVDLTNSSGFWLTYSATAEFWVQLRPIPPLYNGPKKHVMRLPPTGGQMQTHFFPFSAEKWTTISAFPPPDYPLADALKAARSFDFICRTPNTVVFYGLRIDGVAPPCTAP